MTGQASVRELDPSMPRQLKILVSGPFAAGKTTFIRSISDITALSTERQVSDGSARIKAGTTVAMDFGRVRLPAGPALHLFGTPGQSRFDFMWEVLSEGMLGLVLIVDGSRPETFPDAANIARSIRARSNAPVVLAVTRVAGLDEVSAQRWRSAMGLPVGTPVVACDARDRDSVKGVLLALLTGLLERIERSGAPVGDGPQGRGTG